MILYNAFNTFDFLCSLAYTGGVQVCTYLIVTEALRLNRYPMVGRVDSGSQYSRLIMPEAMDLI